MTAKVSALRPPSLQLRSIICSAPFIRTRMHPTVYFSVPRCNKIEEDFQFLPRDVMHKRGLRRHAVSVCLSVCPVSDTFVLCVETAKKILP